MSFNGLVLQKVYLLDLDMARTKTGQRIQGPLSLRLLCSSGRTSFTVSSFPLFISCARQLPGGSLSCLVPRGHILFIFQEFYSILLYFSFCNELLALVITYIWDLIYYVLKANGGICATFTKTELHLAVSVILLKGRCLDKSDWWKSLGRQTAHEFCNSGRYLLATQSPGNPCKLTI